MKKTTSDSAPESNGAIVPVSAPLGEAEETVEQALGRARKQIEFRNGILKLIAAAVNPRDILVYGSAPDEHIWFTETAVKRILSWAGVRFSDPHIEEKRYDGIEGPYIDFECWATVMTRDGRLITTMGNRSTYDDFFARRSRWICPNCDAITHYGNGKQLCAQCGPVQARKESYYLPLPEVDVPAVKQAAITNLWNHALRDLGLQPSIDELKVAGVKTDALKRVRFGDDRASAATPATQKAGAGRQSPPKEAGMTPNQPAPAPKIETVKADLPKWEGEIIESVRARVVQNGSGKGNPYLVIKQGANTLYCFDNRKMGEDERLFDILGNAEGKLAKLVINPRTKDGRTYMEVLGAVRIGDREWDPSGVPILRRESYKATNEDLPF